MQQAIASGSGIAPEVLPNGLYQYTLSDYMLYVLMFADNAGNQGLFPLLAKIDTTADFNVNIVPYLKDGDVVGSEPLKSGTVLSDTQSVVFEFEVTTEGGAFVPGASGLRAEYSFDGVNWYYTDEEFSADVPKFEFGGQAIGDMRIRLVTGAGTAVVGAFGGEAAFGYNKDTAEIALSLSAVTVADGNETPYTPDSWTNATVKVIATVTAGAYGGTLSAEGFEDVRVPENSGIATFAFEIVNNLNDVVTVTFTSDKAGSVSVSEEIAVKIDKDDVNVDLSGAYDNQGTYTVEIGEAGWAFGDVAIAVSAETGASGIGTVEYSYEGAWTTLQQVDGEYRILWANADNETGDQRTYRVRVTSGSGMVGTAEMTVRIDEATAASGTLEYEGFRGSGSDWYYTDVGIAVRNITVNFSGTYFVYTATVIDGGTEADSVSGRYLLDETGQAFMTLTDESFAAGYGEYRIAYSWATGAGNSAPGGEFVIKIDKNVYSFTAQSHIGGITDTLHTGDNRYVVLEDATGLLSEPLYRGMSLNNIGIEPIAPVTGTEEARYEFLIRSISANGRNLINYEYTNEAAAGIYYLSGVTVEGNVSVDVELYCAIVPEFVNTDQSIQANGTYLPVRLSFPIGLYADFRNVLTYSITMPEGFDADDPYGVYDVTAAITGEYAADFPLVKRENGTFVQNDTAALRVRYFENSGTVDDRFTVGNLTDFMMIDRYSDPLDPAQPAFGYGNGNRYFIQTADIAFDASFVGLSNAFDGVYDGNGFAFTSDRVDGGKFSGIFKNVVGGRIENLKVEIFRYEISANGDYGLIAAKIGGSGASVSDVYVAANVYINVYIENSAVNFGGVAGTAENTLISAAFAAVNVFANNVSGNIGGVVGTLTGGSIMSRCVSLSTITNDDCALPDGSGGAALYAGSLVGYADGAGAADEDNYYLNNGVSYGEAAISGRGLGNFDYPAATELRFVALANIGEMNTAQTAILGNTVAELVEYYAESLAERFTVAGVGSEYAPFEIGKAEALELVALAPWAYFIQTDDIVPSSYAEFFGKTPFRGYYDGDAHKLSDVAVSATGGSVGLFRAVEGTLTNLYIDNIYADMLLPQGGYAGALAGIIGNEAVVSGIVLTGSITVDAAGTVYAGGVAGISYGGIDNIVSAIAMRVIAEDALVGGISGNLSGGKVEYVALLGSFTADYSGKANVGTVAGEAVADDESPVSMTAVGYVADSSIAGKYNVTIPFVGETGYVPVSESRNSLIASTDYSSGEYAFTVGERLNGVYPFTSGSGTDADPFVITGYKEFKNIAAYMDASFKLAENFVLGDIDGDGIADEEFTGFGGTFSGSIAGDNKVISGLTAPLFERVSGSIRNLVLNIEVYSEDVSVTFGAVAVTAESGAMLSRITVNGNAEIYTDAAGTIVYGGVVGISDGAAVIMPAVNVDVKLRGGMVVYGGIVGNSTAPAAEHAGTWRIQSSVTADIGGVSVTAGKYIGIMRGDSAVVQSFGTTAAVLKINNVTDASAVGRVI